MGVGRAFVLNMVWVGSQLATADQVEMGHSLLCLPVLGFCTLWKSMQWGHGIP